MRRSPCSGRDPAPRTDDVARNHRKGHCGRHRVTCKPASLAGPRHCTWIGRGDETMPLPNDEKLLALANDLVHQLTTIFGEHPGFRPAHAKGAMFTGTFT